MGGVECRKLGKYVLTPEKLWGQKILKKTWKLESLWGFEIKRMKNLSKPEARGVALGREKNLRFSLWAWNKAETHASKNVNGVLTFFCPLLDYLSECF